MSVQKHADALRSREGAFFGRADALQKLSALYDGGARLVVVVGLGGMGKTRLAVEYVACRARRWSGGVWVCDLSNAASLGELCEVVARALGVEVGPEGARDAVEWLGGALAARPDSLLVLDNFEQLTDHARALDSFLDAAPEIAILVTSRARLRLAREHLLELEPLALPSDERQSSPATDLFVDRARRVRGDYSPGALDSRAIAGIVRELEGIPLSIELVAARMHVLGPEQILSRLRERSELVVTRDLGVSQRHASLRNALEWSWALLDPVERGALSQLAVFPGGFDAEMAARVLDVGMPPSPPVLDALHGLRDNSLLRVLADVDGELRLGMYAAVRELAAEKLDESGRRLEIEARHARAVLERTVALAEQLHGPQGVTCYARLEREYESLLVVFERASAARPASHESAQTALAAAAIMNDVASRRGPLAEHRSRLDRAIDLARSVALADDELVSALLARGTSLTASGEFERAIVDHREAAGVARALGNPMREIECWINVVFSMYSAGQLDEAVDLWDHTLAPAVSGLPSRFRGLVGGVRGLLYVEQGKYDRAASALREAIAAFPVTGDARHAGLGHVSLGDALRATGRADDARRHYEQGLTLVREVQDGHYECTCLLSLGALHHELGERAPARERYVEALAVARRLGARQKETLARAAIATSDADADELDHAEEELGRATRLARELTWPLATVILTLAEGHIALARARRTAELGEGPLTAERERVENLLEQAVGSAAFRSSEAVRSAARLLAAAHARDAPDRERASTPPHALPASRPDVTLADEGALVTCRAEGWFRPPFGERVTLRQHKALALVLWDLVRQRLEAKGVPLEVDRLLATGWPSQRVLHDAGTMRVYGAIATLRRLGLRGILLTAGGGYLLDPAVTVVRR